MHKNHPKLVHLWVALALFCLAWPLLVSAEEDFLRPEQAFQLADPVYRDGRVQLEWTIADGYYLYQSKLRAETTTPEVVLGELELPPAETQKDPIFGEVQVYRGRARLGLPVTQAPAGTESIELKLRYQGCADKGICYPPQEYVRTVAYTPAAAPATVATPLADLLGDSPRGSALDELNALSDDLGLGMEDDILSPEQAYRPFAESADGNTLAVGWQIAEGTYLYQDKVRIRVAGDGVQAGRHDIPAPVIKKDSVRPDGSIGDVAVYQGAVQFDIPLIRTNTDATEIEVLLDYQGCAERGICYPPQKKTLQVSLPAAAGIAEALPAEPAKAPAPQQSGTEQDRLLGQLQESGLLSALLLSLGFGLLVAFTACMYPMIPILSSLIMGHGEKVTPARAFELSLTYTQGIALTFGVLGAVMAVVGKSLGIQSALQTPWVLVPSAILFVALALSMFGFYQIQMPAALQSRLHEMSNRQKSGSLLGVGLMGVLSALIVGPCGGPVLLAVLAFAAQSQDMLLGFVYLWLFGTGMGLPLLLMGAGGGAMLPKAGTWMDTVKATGGVIMLALALSFLERMSPTYIPTSTIMLLWGVLLISVGVYMGAMQNSQEQASGWHKLWKGLGLVLLIYGAAFIVGVAAGGKDTLQPLKGLTASHGGAAPAGEHAAFQRVANVAQLEEQLATAKAAGKPVMLDFYADWCTYCKVMEKEIFPQPRVAEALSGFVLLQADITRQSGDDKALMAYFDLPAPPALYFWDRQGTLHTGLSLVGEPQIQDLIDRANKVNQ